jgi:iron complex outermembrane receptor protein
VRLVGWQKHDAGYVDNIRGTRTFPTSGITDDNADVAEDDYNTADTIGLRGALRFDINENWTITPQLVAQKQKAYGSAGVDPNTGNPDMGYDAASGEMAVKHFYPESSDDRWHQAALTVEGKIGNFDLTYVPSRSSSATSIRNPTTATTVSGTTPWPATAPISAAISTWTPSLAIRRRSSARRSTSRPPMATSGPATNCGCRHRRRTASAWWPACSGSNRVMTSSSATRSMGPGRRDRGEWLARHHLADRAAAQGRDKAVFGELSFDITDAVTVSRRHALVQGQQQPEGLLRLRRRLQRQHRRLAVLLRRGIPRRALHQPGQARQRKRLARARST